MSIFHQTEDITLSRMKLLAWGVLGQNIALNKMTGG
jgi:hypothetical protein